MSINEGYNIMYIHNLLLRSTYLNIVNPFMHVLIQCVFYLNYGNEKVIPPLPNDEFILEQINSLLCK